MNKKKDITLVTAFFDIGRGEIKGFERGAEKYFEYFKVWAQMKNNLIVYTYKSMSEKVIKYRESIGLKDKTKVIVIDDIFKKQQDIYKRMQKIEKNNHFKNFRVRIDPIENRANYCYVTCMKFWYIKDAYENGYIKTDMVSWIDFGFNHKDEVLSDPSQFNFLWKTELSDDKIHLFTLGKKSGLPPFMKLQYLSEDMMGFLMILPTKLSNRFYETTLEAQKTLLNMGFIDDDQMIEVIAAEEVAPELYELHDSYWFMPLKEHGAEHLSVRRKEIKKDSIIHKIKSIVFRIRKKQKYFKRLRKEYDIFFKKEGY